MEGSEVDLSSGAAQLASGPPANAWGAYTLSGQPLFLVDTCLEIKFTHDAKISTFPVELGAFTSYNKVTEPFKCKVKLAVAHPRWMKMFMTQLENEIAAPNIYNVFTPEFTYFSMALEKVSYPRDIKGVNVIVADLEFVQIKQVSAAYAALPAPKKAAHADVWNDGCMGVGRTQGVPHDAGVGRVNSTANMNVAAADTKRDAQLTQFVQSGGSW